MIKLQFLALLVIVLITFCGCFLEYSEFPSLQVVNQYHQSINEIEIFEIMIGSSIIHNYYGNLSITEGNSDIFEVYSSEILSADVKISFGDEYDIKAAKFFTGKTTTITLSENGLLE